jgi:hypothetical protein
MSATTIPQDGFARLASCGDPAQRDLLRSDPAGAFGAANGWSAELIDWKGEPALCGIAVYRGGGIVGPFSDEAIRRALKEGILRPDDAAWNSASRQWTTLAILLNLEDPVPTSTPTPEPKPMAQQPSSPQADILVYKNEQESVAYTPAEARAAIARGELRPDDWAWNATLNDWVPLRSLLDATPAPPAPKTGAAPADPSAEVPAEVAPAPRAPDPGLAPDASAEDARRAALALAEERDLLEKKVAALEKHLAQALKACASLDRLKDELATARQQLNDRQSDLESRSRETSLWQVRASEAEASLASLREETNTLRSRLQSIQRTASEVEARARAITALEAEMERLRQDEANARRMAEEAMRRAAEADSELEATNAALAEARAALADRDARLNQLEGQLRYAQGLVVRAGEAARLLAKASELLNQEPSGN